MNGNAAARLESQEREIKRLSGEMFANALESAEQIATLTARAEQAEEQRDELLEDFRTIERDGLCEVCSFGDSSQISKEDCMEDCCFNYRTWRGLPQDGEGK